LEGGRGNINPHGVDSWKQPGKEGLRVVRNVDTGQGGPCSNREGPPRNITGTYR
jgi:hypothetical protein